MITTFHFAEKTFALHLFLQRFQGLIDIIVAHNNLYDGTLSIHSVQTTGWACAINSRRFSWHSCSEAALITYENRYAYT